MLAWWLCQHTTACLRRSGRGRQARRRWVSERLGMGDESRVTQAIGRLKRKGQPELERLKRRLEQVYENHNAEVEARICEFLLPIWIQGGKKHLVRTRFEDTASVVCRLIQLPPAPTGTGRQQLPPDAP